MPVMPLVILGIGAGLWIVLKSNNTSGTPRAIPLDTITLEKIIHFFKRPFIQQKMQQQKNLIAVAVKTGTNMITLACFDSEAKTVQSEFITYRYKTMDADLAAQFGDKDMIVLQ